MYMTYIDMAVCMECMAICIMTVDTSTSENLIPATETGPIIIICYGRTKTGSDIRYFVRRGACNYQLNSLFDSDFGVSVFMGAPSRFAYLHALLAILLFTWAEAAAAPMFTTRTIIGCASEYIDMRNHAARRFPRGEIMYGGEKISHIEFVILNVIPGARAPL